MIPIGYMDRCITLQQQTETRAVDGGYGKTWADMYILRAAYNYRSGGERFEGDQETAIRTVTWTIRYISGVDEMWRVEYGDELYDIVNVELMGRKRYMVLHCVKKTLYQEK